MVEIAPSPTRAPALREQLTADAVLLAKKAGYHSAGTFEFIVDASAEDETNYAFIEANARLQVEHTVTEEVTGIDIVRLQLELAGGRTLPELGLDQVAQGVHARGGRVDRLGVGLGLRRIPNLVAIGALDPRAKPLDLAAQGLELVSQAGGPNLRANGGDNQGHDKQKGHFPTGAWDLALRTPQGAAP